MGAHPGPRRHPPTVQEAAQLSDMLPTSDKTTLFIERFRGELPDWIVLEPGPYNGRHTKILAQHARQVICIEPREENCRLVRELALPNVSVIRGDVRDLGHPPCAVDVVFHSGVLYHLPDPVEHIHLLARHAARLWLNTHHAGSRSQWHSETPHHPLAGLSQRSYWLGRAELLDTLKSAGWNVTVVDEHDEPNGPRITLCCLKA